MFALSSSTSSESSLSLCGSFGSFLFATGRFGFCCVTDAVCGRLSDVDEEVAEICENCEVRLECLEYGFAEPAALGGCWGGINGWRLRKGRKIWLDSELDVAEILEIITEAEERHGAGQRGPTPQWKVRLRNLGGG